MTYRRIPFPYRSQRFEPDEVGWQAVEMAAGLGQMSAAHRHDVARTAQLYLWAAGEHFSGLGLDEAEKLKLNYPPAWLPAEAFGAFVDGLEATYDELGVGRATVRHDGDGTTGFARFALAIWLALPAYNLKTRSPSAMSMRIAKHRRVGG